MIKPTKPTPIPVPPDAPIRGADGRPVFAVKAAAWIDYQEKKLWPYMTAVVTYNGKAVDYVDSQLTIVNTKANEAKASANLAASAAASLPDGVIIDTQIGPDKTWSSKKISSEIGSGSAVKDLVASNWTARVSAADRAWKSVCWSPELKLFCAVGASNQVMTSSNGISWTSRTTPDSAWESVCWSPELKLFCAVASTGTGNRVMTSSNGIAWTARVSAADRAWKSVCWSPELKLFCAVAGDGAGSYFMASRDGINWTIRSYITANDRQSVCWSPELGFFCAVGAGVNRVVTSPDGTDWIGRTAPDSSWQSVCWSPELKLFCAVSSNGANRVMTSSNGVDWTARESASDSNGWQSVCWSPELKLFCAVASTGIMTSPDGIKWTIRTAAADNAWQSVCWSPELGLFCAVASTGTGNRVMTSLFLPTTGG